VEPAAKPNPEYGSGTVNLLEGGDHLASHIDDKAAGSGLMKRSFCCLKYLLALTAISIFG
jgi:hypothetical protein